MRRTILVVEDDHVLRDVLMRGLYDEETRHVGGVKHRPSPASWFRQSSTSPAQVRKSASDARGGEHRSNTHGRTRRG